MSQIKKNYGLGALGILSTLLSIASAGAAPLPALSINPAEVSVSGISSGGYMAVQLHVAYSNTFHKGIGVVAGGPFYCAEGSVLNAIGRCMAHRSAIPIDSLINHARSWASTGQIDPLSNLNGSRIYLFSGTLDSTVVPAVMNDLEKFYKTLAPTARMIYQKDLAAEHAMVTDDYGGNCKIKTSPYINNCRFDLAGKILTHIYGPLQARNNGRLTGSLIEFDQTPYVTGHGMAATGWVFIPQACAEGGACRLHVALHGCRQNVASVGQQYVRSTGYNRWADRNHIVVLYPQTSLAATNSCWDWWGDDSPDYAKKSGPQMAAIKAMVDQLIRQPHSQQQAPSN